MIYGVFAKNEVLQKTSSLCKILVFFLLVVCETQWILMFLSIFYNQLKINTLYFFRFCDAIMWSCVFYFSRLLLIGHFTFFIHHFTLFVHTHNSPDVNVFIIDWHWSGESILMFIVFICFFCVFIGLPRVWSHFTLYFLNKLLND